MSSASLSRGRNGRWCALSPNRFAVAPGHVAESFEAVLTEHPGFWVIEKFGEAGKIAVELAG